MSLLPRGIKGRSLFLRLSGMAPDSCFRPRLLHKPAENRSSRNGGAELLRFVRQDGCLPPGDVLRERWRTPSHGIFREGLERGLCNSLARKQESAFRLRSRSGSVRE